MIYVERIHHEFKLHYNKLNSNHKKDFPKAYIDDLANRAITEYVDIFSTGTNAKKFKVGFEVTQQRTDMLGDLVVTQNTIIPTSKDESNTNFNIYEFKVGRDYHHFVRGQIKTNCGTFSFSPKQHDDINTLLRSHHTKPSTLWKRFPALFAKSSNSESKSIYIYVTKDINVEEFLLTYIKRPRKVFSGNYDTLEYISGDIFAYNTQTPPQHSDLPGEYLHVLTDIMVDIVSRILNDPNHSASMQDKIINQY